MSLQIGRILEIRRPIKKSQGAESIKVNVAWFYRPEESLGGRKVSALLAIGACCCMSSVQPEDRSSNFSGPCQECRRCCMSQSTRLLHQGHHVLPCYASHGSVPGL